MSDLPTGTVTFLFTDLEGSTRLWEHDREAMRAAVARHDELLDDAITGHGGVVFSRMGDGIAAAFESAPHAVAAAVGAQLALSSKPWGKIGPLRARMGVHTGAGTLVGDQYDSHPLNRCARLMAVAHGGQVVISDATAALVGDDLADGLELVDLGEHRLRDLSSRLRLFQVAGPGLESEFPPVRSVDTFASNLPVELSAFIGRDRDVAALARVLGEARAVTVFGVGGVGKTRLALRVGAEVLPRFADGVWFCELAPIRNGDEVVDAVAAALGYSPPQGTRVGDGLARFLEHKSLLLLLDNCEHLARAVAGFATDTLSTAPGVTVLATSRESVGVPGERLFPLASLELPAGTDPAVVLGSESGALFALRASETRGGFVVDNANSAAVAELCTRLDGIPLAIELAAARTLAMSPAEIVERLDRQFRLLTGATGPRSSVIKHCAPRSTGPTTSSTTTNVTSSTAVRSSSAGSALPLRLPSQD